MNIVRFSRKTKIVKRQKMKIASKMSQPMSERKKKPSIQVKTHSDDVKTKCGAKEGVANLFCWCVHLSHIVASGATITDTFAIALVIFF